MVVMAICPDDLMAQTKPWSDEDDIHALNRSDGAYFAWIKLLTLILGFVGWVILADWVNREGLRLDRYLPIKIEAWNAINIVTFLVGFFAATSIPIFYYFIGLPIFLLFSYAPPILFLTNRNKSVDRSIRTAVSSTGEIEGSIDIVEQNPELPNIEITPKTETIQTSKQIQLTAKHQEGFVEINQMLAHAVADNVDAIAMDANNSKGVSKFMIDGVWHPYMTFEETLGINIGRLLVFMSGANAKKLEKPQKGGFRIKTDLVKVDGVLTTKPSNKALRITVRLTRERKDLENLTDLGMPEEQANIVRKGLEGSGVYIASAAPGQGLSTLWKTALFSTDRWTRDWVGIIPENDLETEMENIRPAKYKLGDTKGAISHIDQAVAKEARAFVLPNLSDRIIVDRLVQECKENERKMLTYLPATNAAEAMLKVAQTAGDKNEMIEQLSGVVYQKLIRKLCDKCRVVKKVKPELIEKLGGNPLEQDFVYTAAVPPAEPEKDYQPCVRCKDIGFKGRTALFEVITVSDQIRKAIKKGAKADAITKIARSEGTKTLQQAAYPLILAGVTSIEEMKRVTG